MLGCDPGAGCSAALARVLTCAFTVASPETGAPAPRFGAPSPLGRRRRDEGLRLCVQDLLARASELERDAGQAAAQGDAEPALVLGDRQLTGAARVVARAIGCAAAAGGEQ